LRSESIKRGDPSELRHLARAKSIYSFPRTMVVIEPAGLRVQEIDHAGAGQMMSELNPILGFGDAKYQGSAPPAA
jgi:hypothetical protein